MRDEERGAFDGLSAGDELLTEKNDRVMRAAETTLLR